MRQKGEKVNPDEIRKRPNTSKLTHFPTHKLSLQKRLSESGKYLRNLKEPNAIYAKYNHKYTFVYMEMIFLHP